MAAAEPRSRRRRGRAQLPGPPAFALALVAPFDQPARDHLRLNLGRAFEDVEDARVAQQPADLIFERIAIAAMDLQARVGVRPGGARGEQLRHARLAIDALAASGRASCRERGCQYVWISVVAGA